MSKLFYLILLIFVLSFPFIPNDIYYFNILNSLNTSSLYIISAISFYYINRFLSLDKVYRDLKWISLQDLRINCFSANGGINQRFWDDVFMSTISDTKKNTKNDDKILVSILKLREHFIECDVHKKSVDPKFENDFKSTIGFKIIWIFKNI